MHTLAVFACVVGVCAALTNKEIAQFVNGVKITSTTSSHKISATGMPEHTPGNVNPNDAKAQNYNFNIPKKPTYGSKGGCLPMGIIGVTIQGVGIFNPLTAEACDAVLVEKMDKCNGHPDMRGAYHHHGVPTCLVNGTADQFIGFALDGFPIYGAMASDLKREVTADDLDECHGREVNGKYRYHVTKEWPYFLGCFKGAANRQQGFMGSQAWCTNTKATHMCSCKDRKVFKKSPGRTDACPERPQRPNGNGGPNAGTNNNGATRRPHRPGGGSRPMRPFRPGPGTLVGF
ncbi:uncharacterized protein LOC106167905 [Lingula anatina]|uniref:Uncharacterized protein LOC106167905 n=1 Tax=Lingula anatina TaxID=7574 RepID=A0A1S3IXI1_LINAN|nr:uncharacterized protein LOC106167905 [Lingula anatina]|eukprot:XP_013402254.1 uncharacterized protein LOC106167905 [Lingula anatina]